MKDEIEIVMSPLCRSFESKGQTVKIDIFSDGDGCWLLEVIDQFGNSTVWDDPFSTDREALDEVLDAIQQDGIGSLIGLTSQSAKMPRAIE